MQGNIELKDILYRGDWEFHSGFSQVTEPDGVGSRYINLVNTIIVRYCSAAGSTDYTHRFQRIMLRTVVNRSPYFI